MQMKGNYIDDWLPFANQLNSSTGIFYGKFHLFQNKDAMHLFNKAELAYRAGIVGFFLLNCHTCRNGSVVKSYFNTRSPSIEEYLSLNKEFVYYCG